VTVWGAECGLELFPECSHLILEYGQSDNPNENSDSELEQVEKIEDI
jgi:hypothetical protein